MKIDSLLESSVATHQSVKNLEKKLNDALTDLESNLRTEHDQLCKRSEFQSLQSPQEAIKSLSKKNSTLRNDTDSLIDKSLSTNSIELRKETPDPLPNEVSKVTLSKESTESVTGINRKQDVEIDIDKTNNYLDDKETFAFHPFASTIASRNQNSKPKQQLNIQNKNCKNILLGDSNMKTIVRSRD